MDAYDETQIGHDLEVVDWLLRSGSISSEDARFMRRYLESLKK